MNKYFYFLILYLFLAPISYHLLPYMGIYGSDLSMQYFYHHCSILTQNASNLFHLAGSQCFDMHNAYYAYPPLIFRFFSFTKFFNDSSPIYYLWSSLIIFTMLALPFIWIKKKNYKLFIAMGAISLFQAPTYFALERGGTDLTFLIPWIAATILGINNYWILAGIFMALAALLKVYPVMAIIPIILGLFIDSKDKYKLSFLKCGFAMLFTLILVFSFDFNLWKIFILEILPRESKLTIGTNTIGHSLIGPFSKIFVYPVMLYFWYMLIKVFSIKTYNYKKFVFAMALAMSTYFTGHSFDYNLISVYPLIYVLIELYFDSESPIKNSQNLLWSIILLILTILGPSNYIFGFFKLTNKIKLLIELMAFCLIPITILRNERSKNELKPN